MEPDPRNLISRCKTNPSDADCRKKLSLWLTQSIHNRNAHKTSQTDRIGTLLQLHTAGVLVFHKHSEASSRLGSLFLRDTTKVPFEYRRLFLGLGHFLQGATLSNYTRSVQEYTKAARLPVIEEYLSSTHHIAPNAELRRAMRLGLIFGADVFSIQALGAAHWAESEWLAQKGAIARAKLYWHEHSIFLKRCGLAAETYLQSPETLQSQKGRLEAERDTQFRRLLGENFHIGMHKGTFVYKPKLWARDVSRTDGERVGPLSKNSEPNL